MVANCDSQIHGTCVPEPKCDLSQKRLRAEAATAVGRAGGLREDFHQKLETTS